MRKNPTSSIRFPCLLLLALLLILPLHESDDGLSLLWDLPLHVGQLFIFVVFFSEHLQRIQEVLKREQYQQQFELELQAFR